MSTSELKIKLFEEIEKLEKSKLEQIYGLVLNFINTDYAENEWNKLSSVQKEGLQEAILEMNTAAGKDHHTVIEK